MTTASPSPDRPMRRRRLPRGLLALLAGLLALASLPAAAQSCWVDNSVDLAFGEVDASGGSPTSDSLRITCNRNLLQHVSFRLCMSIAGGSPIAGVNPRWMTNYNGAQMAYDLYADAAGTRQIGPPGGGFPTYSTTFTLSSALVFQGSTQMQVHGRVRPGQNLPAAHPFQSQIHGGQLRYAYHTSLIGFPVAAPSEAECMASPRVVDFYTHVSATFANSCRITTATDLDFGAVTTLAGSRDQTSSIQLQCPTGTVWRAGLDNGLHAVGGTRRMAGPGGRYLQYELYRDPQRTQRWGNTPGTDTSQGSGDNATQTLTVYGRVPAQPSPRAGAYADTVTVTLTY